MNCGCHIWAGLFKGQYRTTASRPAAITDLSAHCDSGAFTVNWSDISGESGYHLQYSDGTRMGTSNSEMVWTTVDSGGEYDYLVVFIDDGRRADLLLRHGVQRFKR